MVYDNTMEKPNYQFGDRGYAIHQAISDEYPRYSLYTDDGKGNGDFIAGSEDIYWLRRIAYALDLTNAEDFDYNGNPK